MGNPYISVPVCQLIGALIFLWGLHVFEFVIVKRSKFHLLQCNLAEKTTHHKNALMAWQEADNEVKRLRARELEYQRQIIEIQREKLNGN